MVRGPAAWRVRNRRLREVKIARVLGPVKANRGGVSPLRNSTTAEKLGKNFAG
jgi:hypothetical protein